VRTNGHATPFASLTESLFLPDLLEGLLLEASAQGITRIRFQSDPAPNRRGPILDLAEQQLREYFSGARTSFQLPLDPSGTPFQLEVWRALAQIPYGETASYRDIAIAVNRPKGSQAIGQANTRNPIPIVIPCHRVVNNDGSLGGFGGGVALKRQLLELEHNHAHLFRKTSA
jgi:methylated-DNA-[protein]-cysteine S-methyltransferase